MANVPLGAKIIKKLSTNQNLAFRINVIILTFIAFVINRMCRKIISIVETLYQTNCSNDVYNLEEYEACRRREKDVSLYQGALDSSFLFSYAIGMFLCAIVMDKINLRYFVSFGLVLTGVLTSLMGWGKYLPINLSYYIVLQILMGFTASSTWPSIVKVMSNWFEKRNRGRIFGVWCSNTPVGNIAGALIAGLFVDTDWSLSFIVPGIVTIIFGLVLLCFLVPEPEDVDIYIHEPDYDTDTDIAQSVSERTCILNDNLKEIRFLDALRIPGVIEFSVSLFFIKFINTTFLYWLPSFIKVTTNESSSHVANLSTFSDVGGVIGNVIAGFLADSTGKSATVCSLMMALNLPLMYVYQYISLDGSMNDFTNICLMFLMGIMMVGPNFLITTVVCTELGTNDTGKSLSSVIAFIDGIGCLGGAFGPLLAGLVMLDHVFYMLMIACALSVIFLLRLTVKDFKFQRVY